MLRLMERLLRLPPPPAAPPGDEGAVRVFRPSTRYYRLRLVRWMVVQAGSLAGLLVAFGWYRFEDLGSFLENVHLGPFDLAELLTFPVVRALEAWGALFFLLQLPVTLAMVRLDCAMRWYVVTDRSLRVREGLRAVRERTMSFANIQNLSVRQGPVQRAFGIADLRVRTAGGGGAGDESGSDAEASGGNLHLAVFRGVDNPEGIRDLILERMRRLRDSAPGTTQAPGRAGGRRPGWEGVARDLQAAAARLRAVAQRLESAIPPAGADPQDNNFIA
jgi:hypothetical protein